MYHYAGNNPVRYVNPDGRNASETTKSEFRSDVYGFYDSGLHSYLTVPVGDVDAFIKAFEIYSGPANRSLQGDKFSAGFDGIAYVDETGNVVSLFKTEEAVVQEYNRISSYKYITNDDLVIGTMRFMSEKGCTLSLLCYASGNIVLGGIIDGISVACDITLAVYDYKNSSKSQNDKIKLTVDLTTTLSAVFFAGPIAEKLAKSSLKLGQSELNTIITNTIANIIGTEFDCYFDTFLQ